MGTQRLSLRLRFEAKVDKNGPIPAHCPERGPCWTWRAQTSRGYGRIRRGPAVDGYERAHRISWELHHGPIPDGLLVLHHCDNPLCVNPEHLFLGDHIANMADMTAKGRAANAKKTHCPQGHAYDAANTHILSNGGRSCRRCDVVAVRLTRGWDPLEAQGVPTQVQRLALNGVEKTVAEWADHLRMSPQSLYRRLDAGWSVERALTTPPRICGRSAS